MIRIPDVALPAATQNALEQYQQVIDVIPDYAERVQTGKRTFGQYNTSSNRTFRAVRATLTDLCCGARRCMYCEDSCADEVEHFKPKDLYPEYVFVWENYLYSCGRCNGPKNNKYAIFTRRTGQFLEITRPKGASVIPPELGDSILIDPRSENPLDFIQLDLFSPFFFFPIGRKRSRNYRRAEYTIEVLGLNKRPELSKAREEAYGSYHARLEQYMTLKLKDSRDVKLERYRQAILSMHHPSVWREMQRQATLMPELKPLFEAVPEALHW